MKFTQWIDQFLRSWHGDASVFKMI